MSLTSLLSNPAFRKKFKPFRPKLKPALPPDQVVRYAAGMSALVGTAFDYLLRWEIERVFRGTLIQSPWAATLAFEMLTEQLCLTSSGRKKKNPDPPFNEWEKRYSAAFAVHATFVAAQDLTPSVTGAAATACFDLAALDQVYRQGLVMSPFPSEPAVVADLSDLMLRLDMPALKSASKVWLNPSFGDISLLVSGADADLIVDGTLIDVKTISRSYIDPYSLDQLLGYFMLSRLSSAIDSSFPKLTECGIYLSRQSSLVTFPTAIWTEHPEFSDLERWFFATAFGQLVTNKRGSEHSNDA